MTYDYGQDEITSEITMYAARLKYWNCFVFAISSLRGNKHGNGDVYSTIGRTDTLI